MLLKQSTSGVVTVGPILDSDGVAKTDEVVGNLRIRKHGGDIATLDGSATLSHDAAGQYKLTLTANDVDTVGSLEILLNSGTNAMAPVRLNVIDGTAYDAIVAGTGFLAESATVDGVPILVALASMMAVLLNKAEPTSSGADFKNRAGTANLVELLYGTTRGKRTSSTINEEAID